MKDTSKDLNICPFKTEHPDMLIGLLRVEKQVSTDTDAYQSPYSQNTESWD
ncbi:hypothetical protein SAMN02910447_02679 [Ruminococcus sp. YE71]|uniref:hypothetical protein n=1 Tax=unclassified Ruminococcus TaxID=2608920 RepID=UPI0008898B67|nr:MULTISPECIES: hypothetical protein [unclassified Ruminococcus]SDA26592.1 hypothetical protein SAMN02910446_02665 [Ruminococcus sp. YE78]SFW44278.1 hypothetical protein SAMN02910447_02679 [Ruminococcus sp. YE71]